MRPDSSNSALSDSATPGRDRAYHYASQSVLRTTFWMEDSTSSLAASSKAEVGSSSRSTSGVLAKGARNGNALGFASRKIGNIAPAVTPEPDLSQQLFDSFQRQDLSALCRSKSKILCNRAGKRYGRCVPSRACGAVPAARGFDNRSPSTNTVPEVGSSRRLSSRSSELLPDPLGPTTANTSPFFTSKFAS